MRSSGIRGVVMLCLCVALVALNQDGQAAYLTSPGPAPPSPANSPAAPTPQPTTFPMHGVTPGSLQPQECAGRCAVRVPVLGDGVPEAVRVLLPKVLRSVPVRAAGHLRQQADLPLLQQLEDQERKPQMPLELERLP